MCPKKFDRNDNCWAHAFTHVHRPDKKDGRNKKFSLRQVISVVSDPKQIDKLLKDWNTEVKSDYRPENEEDDSPSFMEKIKKAHPDFDFLYDADEACLKIAYHRMGQYLSRICSLVFFLLYKTKHFGMLMVLAGSFITVRDTAFALAYYQHPYFHVLLAFFA
jgi:hypothetical protein